MTDSPICLITGGSTGIGAACAILAAKRGYDIVLNYRSDHASAEQTQTKVIAAGGRCALAPGDVADPEDIARIYKVVDDTFGRIDALINNAGIVGQSARLTEIDHDRLRRMFDVNVIGAMLVAREAVIRMETQGEGVVINISSAAARLGSGNQYLDYAASKAAIDTFTKGLSDEVAGQGIRVLSVRPGIIDTPIHGKGGEPDRADRLGPVVPLGRKGSPDEVAAAILWLLSDEASYITGTTLDVTGGR